MDQSSNCSLALPRKNPKIKKYFYITPANGASKECEICFPLTWKGKRSIHNTIYCKWWNFASACPRECKNTDRPFVRTKPKSLERWLKQTKSEDPNAVYRNEIHEEEMPRNLKQIQNLRYKGKNEMRMSVRCFIQHSRHSKGKQHSVHPCHSHVPELSAHSW